MHELMEVAKYMRKELECADMYAYEANKHKDELPEMAQHYYKAALEHMVIADTLREGVYRMLDAKKRMGHEDLDDAKKVWAFEVEMDMDKRECVQRKLDMYKA
jgi:hypothetical protein